MKECNHPNVVRLYQVIDDLKYDKILLVLEYCDSGEIDWKNYNHYQEKQKSFGLTINRILRDVTNGLEYLHEFKGIIHRDLKPSNLLVKENRIKISDFGVSLILENNANDARELGKTMGTPAFYAPELCQFVNNRLSLINDNKKNIDKRIDIWSLGVILYCLIFNELPFNGRNEFGLFKSIVNKELKFPVIKFSSRFNEEDRKEFELLKDLICKILVKDPVKRYTIRDIKNHDFTTFDMTYSESDQFKRFNDDIINEQLGLTNKIKKFFGGKPTGTINPIKVSEKEAYHDLEPVDELLDSYFDDSSSMGSFDEDVDASSDIEDKVLQPNESKLSDRVKPPPALSFFNSPVKPPAPLAPVATPLSASSSVSSGSSFMSPHIVTIGPNSPSAFYSPTRTFFEKINTMNPTISSLSSPTDNRKTQNDKLDLEPPSIFRTRQSLMSSNSSQGRKNSFGSPLMRITSSSSSLNLNAYLTDDNLSIHTQSEAETSDDEYSKFQRKYKNLQPRPSQESHSSDSEDNEADSTFVIDNEPMHKFKFQDMSQYLDNLD